MAMNMKGEWKKWQWIEGEWLTQFCCSAFHTCFHSPFGNHHGCSNVWPPLLLISHPPSCWWWSHVPFCPSAFPLAISPCHYLHNAAPLITRSAPFCSFVPLLPFTQCSASGCLFYIAIMIGFGLIGARWWHSSEVQSKMMFMGHQISSCHVPVVRFFSSCGRCCYHLKIFHMITFLNILISSSVIPKNWPCFVP